MGYESKSKRAKLDLKVQVESLPRRNRLDLEMHHVV